MTLAADIAQLTAALQRGQPPVEALPQARALAERHSEAPEAWRLCAHVAAAAGLFNPAIAAFARAAALAPDDIGLRLELAQAAMAANRRRAALEAAHAAAALKPADPGQQDALGAAFTFCEEPALALPWFAAANAAAPNQSQFMFNLAAAQRMCGQVDAAEATLARLLALAPGFARAHLMRADLRRQTTARNHVAELEQALAQNRGGPDNEIALSYALSKELEDVGEHARAFAALSRGARLQAARPRPRIDDELAMMARLAQRHDAPALAAGSGFASDEPIFVIGLPRSGTTLVERILSSHPAVSAIGESFAFPSAVAQALEQRLGRPPTSSEIVDLGLELDPAALGRAYVEETRPQTGAAPHFVDKMLINHLYVGLIRRALPNAKLIVLRRDAMDSCYAMYKSFLTGRYAFTSSLPDLARYYAAWSRLMDHWRGALGGALHEVRYEELVADPEPIIRALVGFAGLDWDDRCLSFHTAKTAVTSASASQVRQPIYASSVGAWRRHGDQLGELAAALKAEGVAIG